MHTFAVTLAQEWEEGSDHRTVPAAEDRLGAAAALQDRQLLTEHQDLDVLGHGGARQQTQPAEQEPAEPVGETNRHDPQACGAGLAHTLQVITS
ncbi:hypothetical protein ABIA33_004899 [Streptacidiphilus sp. MAP12-16]|uniref:hypothetical protein n=1 Tax=Streptacidiphilus sp. MAP12-16 TaxID=3156300 RepID=UPI003519AAC6